MVGMYHGKPSTLLGTALGYAVLESGTLRALGTTKKRKHRGQTGALVLGGHESSVTALNAVILQEPHEETVGKEDGAFVGQYVGNCHPILGTGYANKFTHLLLDYNIGYQVVSIWSRSRSTDTYDE